MEVKPKPKLNIDFSDTEIAFSHKSNKDLKRTYRLFKFMSHAQLVNIMSKLGEIAVKWSLPFAKYFVKETLYKQFVGGVNLMDCQVAIDRLHKNNALGILDFGAEGKSKENELNDVRNETVKAVEFAASNETVPVVTHDPDLAPAE